MIVVDMKGRWSTNFNEQPKLDSHAHAILIIYEKLLLLNWRTALLESHLDLRIRSTNSRTRFYEVTEDLGIANL